MALTPEDCRRLLEFPSPDTSEGLRDRALLAVLAYTGCRVGEVCRLRVSDYKAIGGHRVLEIRGKSGKERRVPLHPEAFERIDALLDSAELAGVAGSLFRPLATARGCGIRDFGDRPMTRRAVQYLVARYICRLKIDPNVTVHSFRVTALTTARERGADIVDLQDFAGHADPRTTLGRAAPGKIQRVRYFTHLLHSENHAQAVVEIDLYPNSFDTLITPWVSFPP